MGENGRSNLIVLNWNCVETSGEEIRYWIEREIREMIMVKWAVCSLLVTGIDTLKPSCNSGDPVFYKSLQFSSLLEYP